MYKSQYQQNPLAGNLPQREPAKPSINNKCRKWVAAATVSAALLATANVPAQELTILHTFNGSSDGLTPQGSLVLSGNTLYGTAGGGGAFGVGTAYKINTDGTGFTVLHTFNGTSDGAYLDNSGLILSGNILYGTASKGGSDGNGTVFKLNTDGTGFTVLHDFTGGSDGSEPLYLTLSGNTLYGTAYYGGTSTYFYGGTVFKLNTDGSDFTTLYSFTDGSDGANPDGGDVVSDNTLYGTATVAGSSGYGTVFAVNSDGTGFNVLYSFTGGSDGAYPPNGLALAGNTLYGTTEYYDFFQGLGNLWSINTSGSGFTVLHSFTGGDGIFPNGLILSGTTLYGDTPRGGASSSGTLFSINTDGNGFTTLYNFTGGNDGAQPSGKLVLSGNTLYGAAAIGGSAGYGTLFSFGPPPCSLTVACPANISIGCDIDLLVPVSFSATASDNCDPSPTVTCSPASGSGFPVGTTTVTCTAQDASGNSFSCSFTVRRAALGFAGFLAPIGGADSTGGSFASPVRAFKMGSTIPVKFTASCGGSPVTTGIHTLEAVKYSDATTAGTPIDATPTDAATTGDQFQLNGSQWQFNLDTKATGMTIGIWQLIATLSDGTQHTVWIQLK